MLKLTIVTPEKKFIQDIEIEELFVPGFRGELNILPMHAPLVTTLNAGVVRYRIKQSQNEEVLFVSWGYLVVSPKEVNILAEIVERPDQIDLERTQKAQEKAEGELQGGVLGGDQLDKYMRKQNRAIMRRLAVQIQKGQARF